MNFFVCTINNFLENDERIYILDFVNKYIIRNNDKFMINLRVISNCWIHFRKKLLFKYFILYINCFYFI